MRKQLITFAQVIKFCKISSSRGNFNPNSPCVRPWCWRDYRTTDSSQNAMQA